MDAVPAARPAGKAQGKSIFVRPRRLLVRLRGSRGAVVADVLGGGARAGGAVDEGDYLVTITANGVTMKRVVHVERIGSLPEDPGFGGDDEDEEGEP